MRNQLLDLVWRAGLLAGLAIGLAALCSLFGLVVPLPLPAALGLLCGTVWWFLRHGADRADRPHPPELDLDADYALPHAQDMRVRRLEDLVHGAQPHRRMTARGLALLLGEIAEERARDPDAPPLDPALRDLIATARRDPAEGREVPPIDRKALHRFLHQLAPREERH